ncbi:hypothetical protein HDU96_007853 [Phlyctochytrium bullatum]|nr:hypothetical protein HDU96_007853 [Phlyctochytrium bullatum]
MLLYLPRQVQGEEEPVTVVVQEPPPPEGVDVIITVAAEEAPTPSASPSSSPTKAAKSNTVFGFKPEIFAIIVGVPSLIVLCAIIGICVTCIGHSRRRKRQRQQESRAKEVAESLSRVHAEGLADQHHGTPPPAEPIVPIVQTTATASVPPQGGAVSRKKSKRGFMPIEPIPEETESELGNNSSTYPRNPAITTDIDQSQDDTLRTRAKKQKAMNILAHAMSKKGGGDGGRNLNGSERVPAVETARSNESSYKFEAGGWTSDGKIQTLSARSTMQISSTNAPAIPNPSSVRTSGTSGWTADGSDRSSNIYSGMGGFSTPRVISMSPLRNVDSMSLQGQDVADNAYAGYGSHVSMSMPYPSPSADNTRQSAYYHDGGFMISTGSNNGPLALPYGYPGGDYPINMSGQASMYTPPGTPGAAQRPSIIYPPRTYFVPQPPTPGSSPGSAMQSAQIMHPIVMLPSERGGQASFAPAMVGTHAGTPDRESKTVGTLNGAMEVDFGNTASVSIPPVASMPTMSDPQPPAAVDAGNFTPAHSAGFENLEFKATGSDISRESSSNDSFHSTASSFSAYLKQYQNDENDKAIDPEEEARLEKPSRSNVAERLEQLVFKFDQVTAGSGSGSATRFSAAPAVAADKNFASRDSALPGPQARSSAPPTAKVVITEQPSARELDLPVKEYMRSIPPTSPESAKRIPKPEETLRQPEIGKVLASASGVPQTTDGRVSTRIDGDKNKVSRSSIITESLPPTKMHPAPMVSGGEAVHDEDTQEEQIISSVGAVVSPPTTRVVETLKTEADAARKVGLGKIHEEKPSPSPETTTAIANFAAVEFDHERAFAPIIEKAAVGPATSEDSPIVSLRFLSPQEALAAASAQLSGAENAAKIKAPGLFVAKEESVAASSFLSEAGYASIKKNEKSEKHETTVVPRTEGLAPEAPVNTNESASTSGKPEIASTPAIGLTSETTHTESGMDEFDATVKPKKGSKGKKTVKETSETAASSATIVKKESTVKRLITKGLNRKKELRQQQVEETVDVDVAVSRAVAALEKGLGTRGLAVDSAEPAVVKVGHEEHVKLDVSTISSPLPLEEPVSPGTGMDEPNTKLKTRRGSKGKKALQESIDDVADSTPIVKKESAVKRLMPKSLKRKKAVESVTEETLLDPAAALASAVEADLSDKRKSELVVSDAASKSRELEVREVTDMGLDPILPPEPVSSAAVWEEFSEREPVEPILDDPVVETVVDEPEAAVKTKRRSKMKKAPQDTSDIAAASTPIAKRASTVKELLTKGLKRKKASQEIAAGVTINNDPGAAATDDRSRGIGQLSVGGADPKIAALEDRVGVSLDLNAILSPLNITETSSVPITQRPSRGSGIVDPAPGNSDTELGRDEPKPKLEARRSKSRTSTGSFAIAQKEATLANTSLQPESRVDDTVHATFAEAVALTGDADGGQVSHAAKEPAIGSVVPSIEMRSDDIEQTKQHLHAVEVPLPSEISAATYGGSTRYSNPIEFATGEIRTPVPIPTLQTEDIHVAAKSSSKSDPVADNFPGSTPEVKLLGTVMTSLTGTGKATDATLSRGTHADPEASKTTQDVTTPGQHSESVGLWQKVTAFGAQAFGKLGLKQKGDKEPATGKEAGQLPTTATLVETPPSSSNVASILEASAPLAGTLLRSKPANTPETSVPLAQTLLGAIGSSETSAPLAQTLSRALNSERSSEALAPLTQTVSRALNLERRAETRAPQAQTLVQALNPTTTSEAPASLKDTVLGAMNLTSASKTSSPFAQTLIEAVNPASNPETSATPASLKDTLLGAMNLTGGSETPTPLAQTLIKAVSPSPASTSETPASLTDTVLGAMNVTGASETQASLAQTLAKAVSPASTSETPNSLKDTVLGAMNLSSTSDTPVPLAETVLRAVSPASTSATPASLKDTVLGAMNLSSTSETPVPLAETVLRAVSPASTSATPASIKDTVLGAMNLSSTSETPAPLAETLLKAVSPASNPESTTSLNDTVLRAMNLSSTSETPAPFAETLLKAVNPASTSTTPAPLKDTVLGAMNLTSTSETAAPLVETLLKAVSPASTAETPGTLKDTVLGAIPSSLAQTLEKAVSPASTSETPSSLKDTVLGALNLKTASETSAPLAETLLKAVTPASTSETSAPFAPTLIGAMNVTGSSEASAPVAETLRSAANLTTTSETAAPLVTKLLDTVGLPKASKPALNLDTTRDLIETTNSDGASAGSEKFEDAVSEPSADALGGGAVKEAVEGLGLAAVVKERVIVPELGTSSVVEGVESGLRAVLGGGVEEAGGAPGLVAAVEESGVLAGQGVDSVSEKLAGVVPGLTAEAEEGVKRVIEGTGLKRAALPILATVAVSGKSDETKAQGLDGAKAKPVMAAVEALTTLSVPVKAADPTEPAKPVSPSTEAPVETKTVPSTERPSLATRLMQVANSHGSSSMDRVIGSLARVSTETMTGAVSTVSTGGVAWENADSWTVEEVGKWLRQSLGLRDDVVERFEAHGFDGPALLAITDKQLRTDLGIHRSGLRRSILTNVEMLKDICDIKAISSATAGKSGEGNDDGRA